ncbi:MAG: PD-(D/E)XK nuclease family protein [Thermodesulfovibrionales bacterium]
MVRLYYSANPEALFKEALRSWKTAHHDYSGIIYITPSSLRAKTATKIFHTVLQSLSSHKTFRSCYIPPDITTISELSKRLNSTYGSKTLLPESMIPVLVSMLSGKGLGVSVLISNLIGELKQYHPDRDMEELRSRIDAGLNKFNIPDSMKNSIIDSLEIFRLYQESLIRNNLIDTGDLFRLCPDYIRNYINLDIAIIDGFYSPTKAEMLVIKSIIERSRQSLISIPHIEGIDKVTGDYIDFLKENFDIDEIIEPNGRIGKPQNFKYHPYDEIETEVEGIARHIKSLFIAGKIKDLSDVVIAFPNLDKYKEITERVFNRYGIPFNITRKKSLGQTSPIIDLFCMIQSVCEDYPRLKFSQFLSSRYFKDIPDSLKDWIPTLSLQSGIVSGKKAWLDFFSTGNERCNIKHIINNLPPVSDRTLFGISDPFSIDSLKDLERDLRYIFDRLRPLEEIKNSATLSTFSTTIKSILQEFGFLDITPADEEYRTYSDIKKHLWDCLDELSFSAEVKPSLMRLQEFLEYLRHVLTSTYIETEVEGVTVTDIQGAFFVSFKKNIYIGGLTDEDMPGRDVDYILPDNVKKDIGLPDLDRRIMLQKFLFENIMRSQGNIHLSYPLSEGENRFLPSPFLYSGQQEKEKIPGLFSKEELLVMKGDRPLSEFLSEIKIRSDIPSLKGMLNVTDIDAYRACPRKFFIERVLNLLPPSIKEYDLEATALGEIIHKVMERIILEPIDNIDYLKEKAGEIVEEITEIKNIDRFWKDIIRDTFIEILPEILSMEIKIREEGYKPFKVEEKITGEPIKGIRLKGKIDRIDQSEKGMAIIDYKTGSDTLTCSRVLTGKEKLQLFLYAALLKTDGYNVDRVGIYSLKDIMVKWCPPKRRGKNTIGIDELIMASLKFLEETVKDLRKGVFTARPIDESYYLCRRCHENPLCPYIQL